MDLKPSFKLSLVTLSVLVPSLALGGVACSPCSFSGYSVGAGLGVTTFMTNINSSASLTSEHPSFFDVALAPAPTEGNIMNHSVNDDIYKYGVMGAIFFGYGQVYSNGTYLGAELGLNIFGASRTSQHGASNANYEITSTDDIEFVIFGEAIVSQSLSTNTKVTRNTLEPFLDLKLGYLLTPTTLAYLRGGVSYNTIKIKSDASYSALGQVDAFIDDLAQGNFFSTASATANAEHSHSRTGFNWRLGAGTEVLLTPNVGLGIDYVYTFYRSLNTSAGAIGSDVACDALEGCTTVDGNLAASTKATVADQEVMAQLIYHFA